MQKGIATFLVHKSAHFDVMGAFSAHSCVSYLGIPLSMLCQQPSSVTDALVSISFVISPCLRFTVETVQEPTKAIQRLRVLLLLTHDWI